MKASNRMVTLNHYVRDRRLQEDDFSLKPSSVPKPVAGQVLVKTLALSVDPYMRGRMLGDDIFFLPQFELGKPLMSIGVARVIESKNEKFQVGQMVQGLIDWADYSVSSGGGLNPGVGELEPVVSKIEKISHLLGVLGLNGLTAIFGVVGAARPRRGEVMLLSGAAGGVGILVGQIAQMLGAKVIGLAGSQKKVDVLVEKLGFYAAFDYHSPTLIKDLLALAPSGPDIYFDNVGGELSQRIMQIMTRPARVIECGQISTYDDADGGWKVDIRPIHANGLSWESFTPAHFTEFTPGAIAQLEHWLNTGKLIALETEFRGLDSASHAMLGLLRGDNIGKMVITLDE
jgi:NADPH-dependent curcumin reductase CurA